MIDNNKISVLTDDFNFRIEQAKEKRQEGNLAAARELYLRAANKLIEIAELCPPKLQAAKIVRAQRILELVESLEAQMGPKKVSRNNAQVAEPTEEDGNVWKAHDIPKVSFDDVAGLYEVKETVKRKMINPIKHPEIYKEFDVKAGGGVLLWGPPGTGKTMIAQAIAHEVGAAFYEVAASNVISKWVGESEQNIRALFEMAKKEQQAIIFIDELDTLFASRGADHHNDSRVNEFLRNIDGVGGRAEHVLLIGATNRPWAIDSAAMRSGRFSQKIYVPLPDFDARKVIVQKSLSRAPLADDVDFDQLAKQLDGYSGADIAHICNEAKYDGADRKVDVAQMQENAMPDLRIKMSDIQKYIVKCPPSVSKHEIQMYEKYKKEIESKG